MKEIQQLIKKSNQGIYEDIFPNTYTNAVYDKESGESLDNILSGFNMYFLSYTGSKGSTRLQVPMSLRRQGLWITYVTFDKVVIVEWYNSDLVDDINWALDSNWRVGSNMLVGDISISANGNWIVNGVDTGQKAQGDKGITPLIRYTNLTLQVSYSNGTSWTNLVAFQNNLHIKGYVTTIELLPTNAIQGDIYGVGPIYDPSDTGQTNPIYQLYVKDSTGWINNGRFTSITAGVVQELGNSETNVISQKGVSNSIRNANIIPKLSILEDVEFKEGGYYGSTTEVVLRVNFKYNPVGVRLIPNWNYVYTGGLFGEASILLITDTGALYKRIYFPSSREDSYINIAKFTTPNQPVTAYISCYTLSDTAVGLFEDLSYDIPNKLGKSASYINLNWVDGYYYNSDGELTKYTGTASKFAAASFDVTNITGEYNVRLYCPLIFEAKCIIIDNTGAKRYIYLEGSAVQITIESADVTVLLSTAYNMLPLNESYFKTATYKRVLDIEDKLLTVGKNETLKGVKFSILGDSLSTFAGYIPSGFATQYPSGDVTSVNDTYWGKLISIDKMVLSVNNSWAGTLLSKWANQTDISMCDDRRLSNLGNPDVILVFGGTNDYGYKDRWRNIGDLNLNGTPFDVTIFKQALQYTIQYLQKQYPSSLICFLIPLQRGRYHEYGDSILDYPSKNGLGLFEFQYRDAIKEAASIYGCEVIDTNQCGITYYNGTNNPSGSGGTNLYMIDGVHPNAAGMKVIYQYVRSWLISRLASK